MKVVTTILPYKGFIEAVGGTRVQVTVLVPPGANPHVYELTSGQLKKVSAAALYVKTGTNIEFELNWMDKITALNPNMQVCNTAEGIPLLDMDTHGNHPKQERDADIHHHEGKDPHVWLSPINAMRIVENIKDALADLDPAHAQEYAQNAENYKKSLVLLDTEIRQKVSGLSVRAFIDFHPDWGYFAHAYGLQQIAIEVEGKEPSAGQLAEVIRTAKKYGIKTVFVSPQINPKTAGVIADEIRGRVALVDPLAEDYIRNLREVAAALLEPPCGATSPQSRSTIYS